VRLSSIEGTNDHMPVLVLLALALTSGAAAGFVAWRYPRIARQSATPALDVARKAGETVGRHPSLRAVLDARLDPAVATGLALTSLSSPRSAEGCAAAEQVARTADAKTARR
jgi:hypothetical protein